jgi:hypothetical protein
MPGVVIKKILTGDELEKEARELGVDIQGNPISHSISGSHIRAPDYELQRRVFEAKRSIRESRLWIIALISSIAAVLSALCSCIIAFKK